MADGSGVSPWHTSSLGRPPELTKGRDGQSEGRLPDLPARVTLRVLIVSRRGMRNRVWCVGLGVESPRRAAESRREACLLSDRYNHSGEKRTRLDTAVQR